MRQRRTLLLSLLCSLFMVAATITTSGCTTMSGKKHETKVTKKVARHRGHKQPKYYGLYRNKSLNKRLLRRGEHEMYSSAFDEY